MDNVLEKPDQNDRKSSTTKQRGFIKDQVLIKATKEKKLWRAITAHILIGYGI